MPTEPHRQIEDLLRAAAQRRRRDFGPPLGLHPATRRMLQGEVARQFAGRRRAGDGQGAGVFGWLMRLAVPAAVVVVGLVAILPMFSTAVGSKKQKAAADAPKASLPEQANALSPPPPPAAPSVAAPARSADTLAARPPRQTGPALGMATDQKDAAIVERSLAVAPEPGGRALRPEHPAPPTVAAGASAGRTAPPESLSALSATSQNPVVAGQRTVVSAPTPAPVTTATAEPPALGREAETRDRFRRRNGTLPAAAAEARPPTQAGEATTRFSNQVAQPAPPVAGRDRTRAQDPAVIVLNDFRWEQSGDRLVVIDRDGSRYDGALVGAPQAGPGAAVALRDGPAPAPKRARGGGEGAAPAAALSPNQATAQEWFGQAFRVTGTNRTLRQRVEFHGTLLNAANFPDAQAQLVPPGTNVGTGANAPRQQQANFLNLAPNAAQTPVRIQGQAVVGEQRVLHIDATPLPPR